jgi:GlpG protein
MRMIGDFADESAARRFADYLLTLNIIADARQVAGAWTVWIALEDDMARGGQELHAFRANPDDEKYLSASGTASTIRKQAQRAERAHQKNTIALRDRLNRITLSRCPVTHALIALSIIVAMLSNVGRDIEALAPFYFSPPTWIQTPEGWQVRSARLGPLREGQLWRLWTSIFIHYGWRHLIFNMLALYQFGGLIELRKSWKVLLALVLVAAPASSLAQYLWDYQTRRPTDLSLPGGMSGVVYALFGYVWMKSDYEPETFLRISTNSVIIMLGWLVVCMFGVMGSIANAAHLSGLIYGMCVGLTPYLWRGRRAS